MASKLKTDILETVSGSGTIALTNQLSGMTDASMPSGSVVQVVQLYNSSSAAITSTSASWSASGITATITPKYIGSKILVSYTSSMATAQTWGKAVMYMYDGGWAIMSGATNYQIGYASVAGGDHVYSPQVFNGNVVTADLDAISFQPYIWSNSGTYTFIHAGSSYAITLTEIKG